MRLFVFARHPESAANAARVLNGDPSHHFGLTPRGEHQAALLGRQLEHVPIDLAVYTRLRRTEQTVEIALRGRGISLFVERDLDELDAGAFEGRPIDEYWAWKERHRDNERLPGGESLDNALARYAGALRRLLERDDPVTLIVCHELAIRHISAADTEIPNAVPHLFDDRALRRALDRLERSFTDLAA
jgi:broad specificity phosphatase PhoE